MKKLFLVAVLLALTGCATNKPLSREEQLQLLERKVVASQMDFVGVNRDRLIKAIENTLYLIDPKDVRFQHSKNRIVMRRSYLTILIFANVVGEDIWVINIGEQREGITSVSISLTGWQQAGMYINNNASAPNLDIKPEDSWLSEAELKLIFERINYFLDRGKWISCAQAPKFANDNKYTMGASGRFPYVCGDNWHGVNPESPEYLFNK